MPVTDEIITRVKYIAKDEGPSIMEVRLIFEGATGNPIADNYEYMEHINASMNNAKCEDRPEENNK